MDITEFVKRYRKLFTILFLNVGGLNRSNWGLSVSLFHGVVISEPPSEREVAAEGRRKEPCGMNDSGEENNYISGNSEIISSKFTSSRGLPHPLCGSSLPEGAKGTARPNDKLPDKPQFEIVRQPADPG